MARSFIPVDQINNYVPNRPGAVEVVFQPFYDFQTYPTVGAVQILFFQVPLGQGATPKTFGDTNMTLAGQFPSPTTFVINDVQVYFQSSAVVSLAAAAFRLQAAWVDTVSVLNAGVTSAATGSWLELSVGSKTIFRDAPLNKFPVNFTIDGIAGIAMEGTAAAEQTDTQFARSVGKVYEVIPIAIPQNQNFAVSCNWAAAVAATATSRIGVIMNGAYYRLSQ